MVVDFARIGKSGDVFGLVTPLDHPPETTQWVTAWVGGLYILYIYRGDDGVYKGGWSSGVTRPKTISIFPDPRDKYSEKMILERNKNKW